MDGEALACDDKTLHGSRIKLSKVKSSITTIRRKKEGLQVDKPEMHTTWLLIQNVNCIIASIV